MGPHLALKMDLVVFLNLRQEVRGFSRVLTGIWGNLLRFKKEVKPLFKFGGGTRNFSRVAVGNWAFISR